MSPANLEILAYEPSRLGMLLLRRRELLCEPGTIVTEVTLNHEFLMSSYHTASERALAQVALEMHPGDDLKVLVGGLGLGYTAHETPASSRVGLVEVIEYLPEVIDWLHKGLVPLADELNGDSRLSVVEGDVYERLSNRASRQQDLILIDVDHSPDERLGRTSQPFYTESGLRKAREHLAPGGVLGVWSYAENSPFANAMRNVFGEVRIEPVTFENNLIGEQQTDWLFFAENA